MREKSSQEAATAGAAHPLNVVLACAPPGSIAAVYCRNEQWLPLKFVDDATSIASAGS